MTNRQDRRFAQPQAARRVASTDGRNDGNEKSHFFISVAKNATEGIFSGSHLFLTAIRISSGMLLYCSLQYFCQTLAFFLIEEAANLNLATMGAQ